MEIRIVKAEGRMVTASRIEMGKYYKVRNDDDGVVFRRVKFQNDPHEYYHTSDSDDHITVVRDPVSEIEVHPCDADGNLLESAGAAKVRADEIGAGNAYINDRHGYVSVVMCVEGESVKIVCFDPRPSGGDKAVDADWESSGLMVTPCTVKEIVVVEGVA